MTRLAWYLAAVCVGFAVADTVITALTAPLLSEQTMAQHGWPFVTVAALGSAALGALIVSLYPRHRIGWLLIAGGVTASLSIVTEAYNLWVLRGDGPGSDRTGHIVGWISSLFGGPLAFGLLALIFFLVPDGNPLSRRWRWGIAITIGGVILYTAGVLTIPPTRTVLDAQQSYGLATDLLFTVGFLALTVGLIASVICLLLRLKRSRGERRQQLRWVAVSAASLGFGVVWLLVVQLFTHGEQTWLDSMPLFVSYFLLPIGIAVAVLRYRLYDVDLIINRAVILTIGTVFAAVGYIGVVVGVGIAVGNGTGGFWPSLLATALVALAFQPVRTRVVQLADRFAYGEKAIPYEALADLSKRIGESPAPEQLLPTVAQAAAEAVSATAVTVRLTLPSRAQRSATWPADDASSPLRVDSTTFAVADDGEALGSIEVRMPSGRALRARDHQLLSDLADQVALAFRQARLSEELADQVELLDRQAGELVESRARIIAARDAERSRLETTIRREVIAYIQRLPAQLDEICQRHDEQSLSALSEHVDRAVLALESLREITRGIFPTQLARSGLAAAISGHLGGAGRSGVLEVSPHFAERRFQAPIEAAIYFCYVETVRMLDAPVTVELDADDQWVTLAMSGVAIADPDIQHLEDRLDPLGGVLAWVRAADRSVLTIKVPLAMTPGAGAADVALTAAAGESTPTTPR
jgi:GAF domain-containing protein